MFITITIFPYIGHSLTCFQYLSISANLFVHGRVTRDAQRYCLKVFTIFCKEIGLKTSFLYLQLIWVPMSNNDIKASVILNAMSATLHSLISMFRQINCPLRHGLQTYWPSNNDTYLIHHNNRYQDSLPISKNRHHRGFHLHCYRHQCHRWYQFILIIVLFQVLIKLPGKQQSTRRTDQ